MDASTHYNAKACTQTQAGPRTELHMYHNLAKRQLLGAFARGANRLLDLACGRGGDVHKWKSFGIAHVTGLDASLESICEARRRSKAAKCPPTYVFHQCDLRHGWDADVPKFDVVTCMFALHYFFESEESAHSLMRTVARHLAPGGCFVGIVPDALQVNERIKHGPFDNGVMKVDALWTGKPQCFGSAYTCMVRGTVTEDSSVPEYLVYGPVLETLAALYGLEPVPIMVPAFTPGTAALHPLKPPYGPPSSQVTTLYSGFAFRMRPTP